MVQLADAGVAERIKAIWVRSRRSYGTPRMHTMLAAIVWGVSHIENRYGTPTQAWELGRETIGIDF